MADRNELVTRLLEHAGTTYADEAGITLKDTPKPLFQLLVLCMLASKPIDAGIDAAELGALAESHNARLAAALVRVSLDDKLRDTVAG